MVRWAVGWLIVCALMLAALGSGRQAQNACGLPEYGADVYLLDGSFEGMRGIVTGFYQKPGSDPIVILRTYHDGLTIMVPCMDWMPARGPYTLGG